MAHFSFDVVYSGINFYETFPNANGGYNEDGYFSKIKVNAALSKWSDIYVFFSARDIMHPIIYNAQSVDPLNIQTIGDGSGTNFLSYDFKNDQFTVIRLDQYISEVYFQDVKFATTQEEPGTTLINFATSYIAERVSNYGESERRSAYNSTLQDFVRATTYNETITSHYLYPYIIKTMTGWDYKTLAEDNSVYNPIGIPLSKLNEVPMDRLVNHLRSSKPMDIKMGFVLIHGSDTDEPGLCTLQSIEFE